MQVQMSKQTPISEQTLSGDSHISWGVLMSHLKEFLGKPEEPLEPSSTPLNASSISEQSEKEKEKLLQEGEDRLKDLSQALIKNLGALNTAQDKTDNDLSNSEEMPNLLGGMTEVFDAMETLNTWFSSNLQQIVNNAALQQQNQEAQQTASSNQLTSYEKSTKTTETILRVIIDVVTLGTAELSPNYSNTLEQMATSGELQDIIKGVTIAVSAITILCSLATGNVVMAAVAASLLVLSLTGVLNDAVKEISSAAGKACGDAGVAAAIAIVATVATAVLSDGASLATLAGTLLTTLSQSLASTSFAGDLARALSSNSTADIAIEVGVSVLLLAGGLGGGAMGAGGETNIAQKLLDLADEDSNPIKDVVRSLGNALNDTDKVQAMAQAVSNTAQGVGGASQVAGGSVTIAQGKIREEFTLLQGAWAIGKAITQSIESSSQGEFNSQQTLLEEYQSATAGWGFIAAPAQTMAEAMV